MIEYGFGTVRASLKDTKRFHSTSIVATGSDSVPPGALSLQTTERYLGCIQRIASAVNDRIGIEPAR
jgi:hypothetical protein